MQSKNIPYISDSHECLSCDTDRNMYLNTGTDFTVIKEVYRT